MVNTYSIRLGSRLFRRVLAVAAVSVLAFTALLSVIPSPCAYACDCDPLSFDEAVEEADLIAEITILSKDEPAGGGETAYVAAVEKVWKGPEERVIDFYTHAHVASCGLGNLAVGETLTVWASGAGTSFSSTWCQLPAIGDYNLTTELGEPADLSDEPLPGSAPDPGAPGSGISGILPFLIVLVPAFFALTLQVLGFIPGGVFLLFLVPRRGR